MRYYSLMHLTDLLAGSRPLRCQGPLNIRRIYLSPMRPPPPPTPAAEAFFFTVASPASLFTSLRCPPCPPPCAESPALGEQSPLIEVHSTLGWKTGL